MNASERPRPPARDTYAHLISTEKCTVLCLSKRLTMLRKDAMHNSLEFQSSSPPPSLSSPSANDYLEREREKRNEMFIMYTFVLRLCTVERERTRARAHSFMVTQHSNSNDVASFSVPHVPPHHRLCLSTRICAEVVVVIVIVMLVMCAGDECTEQEEKKVRRKTTRRKQPRPASTCE